jgi:NAD-dependent deacetylase
MLARDDPGCKVAGMRVFVLTGAGVSAESGLSTFRDATGIWSKVDFREVATPEGFARDPAKVHAFYNARRANLLKTEPNAAHLALARLQAGLAARGDELYLCTQNVDDLHERAGARDVVHMHGELLKARCLACDAVHAWREDLSVETPCPGCGDAGGMRPDVVWFGETPYFMDEISEALAGADRFVSIGTSGSVWPAAGFALEARRAGIATCEINLQPSETAELFEERVYGRASEELPAWVERVLAKR